MMRKNTSTDNTYLPVAWEYLEIIKEQIAKKNNGKIFYFDKDNHLEEVQGVIVELIEIKNQGTFLVMEDERRLRIDRIITLFGKIGAAYDEYDALANACMDCTGGYTKEELENM